MITSRLTVCVSWLCVFHGCVCVCVCAGSQESDSSQTAKKDMLAALRARQDALEDTLKQRMEELKNICIREAVRSTHTHTASLPS